MLAVSVYPSVGNFCTDTCVSERCVRPPKGSSTVEAPIVESNISISPFCERTLSSARFASIFSRSVPPLHLAAERIAFLDRTDRGLGIVLGPCAVDELARKIDH